MLPKSTILHVLLQFPSWKSLLSKNPLKPKTAMFSLNAVGSFIIQVGYAMTTFQRETDQPVIGFDMGGNVGLGDLWVCIINNHFNYKTNLRRFHGWLNLSCCTLVAVSILWSSVHSYYCSKWWNQSSSVRFLHSMLCHADGCLKG